MYDIVGSIVVFENEESVLAKAIDSFQRSTLKTCLYVVDNSSSDRLRSVCQRKGVEYTFHGKNVGFGAGHNIVFRKILGKTRYVLALNPDVYFEDGTLETLLSFMDQQEDVGLVMPKILYPDGSLQYLCRLLPDPLDMAIRKVSLGVVDRIFRKKKIRYELRFADYAQSMDVPCLSGCFMFMRADVLYKVGMFDERFFLYFEDVDFSRRIHKIYRTVYYPQAVAYHGYQRASYTNIGVLRHHVLSGFKYFYKWGWFLDQERQMINDQTVKHAPIVGHS